MKKIYILLSLCLCVSPVVAFVANENASSSCVILTSTLRVGSRDSVTGGQVTKLQQFLKEKGYLTDAPTGYYGMFTKGAVQSFQRERALEAVGFVGPATRSVIKSLTCNKSSQTSLVPHAINLASDELKAYQVIVDGNVQVDASSVSKVYAEENCKKMAESNRTHTLKCVWGAKEIYTSMTPVETATTQGSGVSAPSAQPVVSTKNLSPVVDTTASSGMPSVRLLVAPTSVSYGGGYDFFELKTTGMSSCTLYFKDEPSMKWISGGSSLGVNFALPGYKGMTTSRSFYASCVDTTSKVFDSEIVKITVTPGN